MTRIEYITSGKPDAGFALFDSESLKWPGFAEFDDVNGKVLTYSAQDSIYKVFDLKNYTMLYSTSDKNVQEIKIRLQCLLPLNLFLILVTSKLSKFHMCNQFYCDAWKRKHLSMSNARLWFSKS